MLLKMYKKGNDYSIQYNYLPMDNDDHKPIHIYCIYHNVWTFMFLLPNCLITTFTSHLAHNSLTFYVIYISSKRV